MNRLLLSTVKCNFLLGLLPVALLASDGPPLPPVPKTFTAASGLTQGSGAQALTAVVTNVPPKSITVMWNPSPTGNVTYNVYHATVPHLSAMTLYGSTPQNQFHVIVNTNLVMEFFQVKACQGTNESDWATR